MNQQPSLHRQGTQIDGMLQWVGHNPRVAEQHHFNDILRRHYLCDKSDHSLALGSRDSAVFQKIGGMMSLQHVDISRQNTQHAVKNKKRQEIKTNLEMIHVIAYINIEFRAIIDLW